MNNQEIINNAPEGATHIEDNSNLYIKVLPRVTSTIFNDWFIFEIDQWIIIDTYNVLLMRSLADIKRITDLEGELRSLVRGIKDLGSISYDQFPDTKTAENILKEPTL